MELGFPDRASLARMTVEDAQTIVKITATYEFPFSYDLALRFALFKVSHEKKKKPCIYWWMCADPPQTYTVKNVAKTLASVSDFRKADAAPKR